MTAKIIPLAVVSRRVRHQSDSLFLESAHFSSMCPICKDSRSQLGYSARALVRHLYRDQPIEAHCVICRESWPIHHEERVRLAKELGFARRTSSFEGHDFDLLAKYARMTPSTTPIAKT
jgi:hypothetical protein